MTTVPLFVLLSLAVTIVSAAIEYAPVVEIKQGKVIGVVEKAEHGRKVYHYNSIRYGHAKRFERPTEAETWHDTWNATYNRFVCPQFGAEYSERLVHGKLNSNEDCLYLNVWQSADAKTNRSVFLYIHGGTFQSGNAYGAHQKHAAAIGDVVGVSINYRLNALGFVVGEGAKYSGNMGLHDQILALRWVQTNIHKFGGNPNDVTIYGVSAGSMSVAALILSPLTKGLFHRGIMQSGGINIHGRCESYEVATKKTKALAAALKYNGTDLAGSIEYLKKQSVDNLVHAPWFLHNEMFMPRFGDDLLPADPYVLMANLSRGVDLIFGNTANEGSGYVWSMASGLDGKHELTLAKVKEIIRGYVQQFGKQHDANKVADFYTKHLTDNSTALEKKTTLASAHGDHHLICPTLFFGEAIIARNRNSSHRFYAYEWMQHNDGKVGCTREMGICHGMDTHWTFGSPIESRLNHHKVSNDDYNLSRDNIVAWTNFAKTGSPGKFGHIAWPEAVGHDHVEKNNSIRYLQILANHYQMADGYFKDRCNVWRSIMIGRT